MPNEQEAAKESDKFQDSKQEKQVLQAPDAQNARTADRSTINEAQSLNKDRWESEHGIFAIVDENQVVASKQTSEPLTDQTKQTKSDEELDEPAGGYEVEHRRDGGLTFKLGLSNTERNESFTTGQIAALAESNKTAEAGKQMLDALDSMPAGQDRNELRESIKSDLTKVLRADDSFTASTSDVYEGGTFKAISDPPGNGAQKNIEPVGIATTEASDTTKISDKTSPSGFPTDSAIDNPNSRDLTAVLEELGALPLDKQIQIVGMGVLVFQQELQRQQIDIAKGIGYGVGEGFESLYEDAAHLVQGIGQVWQFGQDVMTNNPRALETGASAGEAIGKTLVGGVRIFEMSHDYLFQIGYTGDYSKPFTDISNLANELDRRWNELTPGEQAHVTAKLSTEFLGNAAIPLGVSKIAKSEKLTAALEKIATKAKSLGGATSEKVAEGIGDVVDGLTDMVTPTEAAATDGSSSLGRRKLSDLVEERRARGEDISTDLSDSIGDVARQSDRESGRILHQPINEVSQEDYLEKLTLKEKFFDYLDEIGFGRKDRIRRWNEAEVKRLAELPDPLDPVHSLEKASEIALEYMVKPWGIENEKVREHYERCKKVLQDSIPPEDIMALYGKGGDDAHQFHFPNRVRDVDHKLAKTSAFGEGADKVHHLGGVTVPDQRLSIVPRLRRGFESGRDTGKLIIQERIPATLHTHEFSPEGVVRHEAAMALMDRYGWKTPSVEDHYRTCFSKGLSEFERLRESTKQVDIDPSELSRLNTSLSNYERLKNHFKASTIGLEQTLADLYAIRYGGSSHGAEIDSLIKETFHKLFEYMDDQENWFRG